ncbi:unnamed protein product [Mytilus coruscus]|uniref:B box-type domain-containing protein n=1 Tax=Mytilus coruscus TaxID=42192 RepID=A0A6J8CY40_MYTCO|nr:unnamed protein product [Mytilus coruscus]
MAHSTSVKRSQIILACGLCETDTKIKVKCMDCDLYMCQKCTDKIHSKFKNADLHSIVALQDIHSHTDETGAKSELKPVKCKDHRKQLCCMYCLTCELLVCPMCIPKTHHLHLIEEIRTFCQKKVEEMKKQKDQAHTKIKKFIEKLNLMAEIEISKSYGIEKKILEEEKQAREVQSQCLRLLQEHKETTKRHADQMSKKQLEILKKGKDIEMVMQKLENIHKSQDTETFLEIACNLNKKLESIEQSTCRKSLNIKIQQYIPRYKIQTNSKSLEMEIQVKIKAKYEINMLGITSITSDKDGSIWITDGTKQIQQLQVKEEIKTLKSVEMDHSLAEIRCVNEGVLITSSSFPQICLLAADNELKVYTDLSPSEPFTLHVSDNEIIVGLDCSSVKDKTNLPIIMRLGFNGKIIQVYKNHGRQLLTRDVV